MTQNGPLNLNPSVKMANKLSALIPLKMAERSEASRRHNSFFLSRSFALLETVM